MNIGDFLIPPGAGHPLNGCDPGATGNLSEPDAARRLEKRQAQLADLQDRLLAQEDRAVLILFQGMDASLKDETVKDLTFALDPQIVRAHAFKQPDGAELRHSYLWRFAVELPQRGHISIFNRSYYEEIVTSRIHPERLDEQQLPESCREDIWERRTRQINDFERYLHENGTLVLKFFMHVSREVQCERLLDRLRDRSKQWQFSTSDIEERQHWDDYMRYYDEAIANTSTEWAPWYVLPADHRWFASLAAAEVLATRLESLGLEYPEIPPDEDPDRSRALDALGDQDRADAGW